MKLIYYKDEKCFSYQALKQPNHYAEESNWVIGHYFLRAS